MSYPLAFINKSVLVANYSCLEPYASILFYIILLINRNKLISSIFHSILVLVLWPVPPAIK